MAKLYLLKDVGSPRFEQLLEKNLEGKFKKDMTVAVKLHMGEGKGMFLPELARRAINVLLHLGCKPFLFDTPVMYPGPRNLKLGYMAIAATHGFTNSKIGCPVMISDDYVKVKTDHMDVEVSKELAAADAVLVLTHFKGHDCAAFGGAIKNLAMGGVSKKSKQDQHSLGRPRVNKENCTACGICENVCPFKAIRMGDHAEVSYARCAGCNTCVYNCQYDAMHSDVTFDRLLAEACMAALSHHLGKENRPVFFVNDIRRITAHCDCFRNPGDAIVDDVGALFGDDPVAIDKASLDLVNRQKGKDVFKERHNHDPYLVIAESEKLGLGSPDYEIAE